jgi:hypothetical protein
MYDAYDIRCQNPNIHNIYTYIHTYTQLLEGDMIRVRVIDNEGRKGIRLSMRQKPADHPHTTTSTNTSPSEGGNWSNEAWPALGSATRLSEEPSASSHAPVHIAWQAKMQRARQRGLAEETDGPVYAPPAVFGSARGLGNEGADVGDDESGGGRNSVGASRGPEVRTSGAETVPGDVPKAGRGGIRMNMRRPGGGSHGQIAADSKLTAGQNLVEEVRDGEECEAVGRQSSREGKSGVSKARGSPSASPDKGTQLLGSPERGTPLTGTTRGGKRRGVAGRGTPLSDDYNRDINLYSSKQAKDQATGSKLSASGREDVPGSDNHKATEATKMGGDRDTVSLRGKLAAKDVSNATNGSSERT